jgi:hypothetical protein
MTAAGDAAPGAEDGVRDDADLRREGERIAQLIDDLGSIAGAPVRDRVDELMRRLLHLYGTGLGNLLRILGGEQLQRIDADARARIRGDALLSSLLVLHGLHPDPEAARDFDPGPDPAASPPHPASHAGGLVQIDLGRSRAAKSGQAP